MSSGGRDRSPKEWTARCRRRRYHSSRRETALEAVADGLLGQFTTDEDKPALARLAILPLPLMIALQHHVHALEDVAVVIALEGEDALGPQDLLTFGRTKVL